MSVKKLAIIGAGASGLCAAIEAKKALNECEITVYDRMPKAAKKILVTGNGRCNFTNRDLSPANFYGDKSFLRDVLSSAYSDSESFFHDLGILPYIEDGRIYPRSQQASAIRDVILSAAAQMKINILTDTAVTEVNKKEEKFHINGAAYDAVIVAGGGKSSAVHGSDGSAYALLTHFGHTCTPLYPALSAISSHEKTLKTIKGVRCEAEIKLYANQELLGKEYGEIQFNDGSISGIPVMNLSRLCKDLKNLRVELDLCREFTPNDLKKHITDFISNMPAAETETLLTGLNNQKLGFSVMEKAKIAPHTLVNRLSESDINKILNTLKHYTLAVDKAKDFDSAQITDGGIDVKEFDSETMMSRLCDGLFACGEILNIHGNCGGYNLHLAWTTGRIAGHNAAKYISGNERK